MPKKTPEITLPLPVDARLLCALRVIAMQKKTRWHYIDHLLDDGWVNPREKEYLPYTLTDKAKKVSDEAPAAVQREATAWQMREMSPKMWTMLEQLHDGKIDGVPYRTGSINTVHSLSDRGLLHVFGERRNMAISIEGRRIVAAKRGSPVFQTHKDSPHYPTHLPPEKE